LCLAGKEFKQDAKDVVKTIVKFIRKGIHLRGENDGSGFKVGIFTEKLLVLGPFGPWGDFLGLGVIVLLKDTRCNFY
jgi:hypothetical protein